MKSKSCAIVQPHYLPWLGYFELIKSVDIFVILDDVQYVKREWKNRNKIRKSPTSNEFKWLSVPIKKEKINQNINEVNIFDENQEWRKFHIDSLKYVYGKTQNFLKYKDEIFSIIENKKILTLFDLNLSLIKKICEILYIKTPIILSSTYKINKKREHKLVDICLRLSCDRYLANNKTFNMVDRSVFSENNIKIIPQNYEHIKYNQMYDNKKINWISNLSVIDYLFNKPY
jgi:hypothetical protein